MAYLKERRFLNRAIEEVQDKYDYVLIDCPPNLYLMTQNALVASHYFIVPAIPDYLSTIGLNILVRKVRSIGQLVDQTSVFSGGQDEQVAKFGGVIFVKVRLGGTMITNRHNETMARIVQDFGEASCFKTYTTEMIGYSDAAESFAPIWDVNTQNARRAAAKGEYEDITIEFTKRFP